MNTKQLLLFASFLSLMGINACTNEFEDLDILDLKSDPFILRENTLSLDNLSDETERQMTNSMLRLKSKKMLDISKSSLSANDFFGTGQACFPVYKESLTHFELYPYDSLRNDTLMFHNRMDYLEEYVDSILNDDFDYYVYELTWKSKGQEFNTIALYDSYEGLVYDNILFNIINICHISDLNKNKRLSRTENLPNGCWTSGTEYVAGVYNGAVKAEVFLSWYEFGHMGTAPIYNHDTLYAIQYYYVHDRLNYYMDQWSGYQYSTIQRFADYSNLSEAKFTYCIWAGPENNCPNVDYYFQFYSPNYIVDLSNYPYGFPISYYEGFVKMIYIQPSGHIEPI
ncbi:MAG: hypothetical protein IKS24_00610 [Bacteroidaceae bacterium]|nr:hypothetical protein [Bacteroidaceae bacterium]